MQIKLVVVVVVVVVVVAIMVVEGLRAVGIYHLSRKAKKL